MTIITEEYGWQSAEDLPAGFTPPKPPSLVGRRVQLVPILPEFHRALFALVIDQQVAFRWRFNGGIPPFEVFQQGLHSHVLSQFAVVPAQNPQDIRGWVSCYNADLHNGTGYLAVVTAPEFRMGLGIEASALFAQYLFSTWAFRTLYIEALEFNYSEYASGVSRGVFQIEGLLRDFQFYDGRHWNKYILSISRESFKSYFDSHMFLPDSNL